MSCCKEFDQAADDGIICYSDAREILDGPLMNTVISEYFIRKQRQTGFAYYPINYCPFCGMPRSSVTQGSAG
ncbi:MAG TPA: hypothetical protein VJX67_21850 [Blastocatellia bacterium]|nr:hypothetical protein [Blastocatellia bacterium]